MKIGASTLSGFKDDIGTNLEYFEELGLDYAEILHQYPNQDLDTSIFENYSLKYSVHSPIINLNIASLTENIRQASIAEIKNHGAVVVKADDERLDGHIGHDEVLPVAGERHVLRVAHGPVVGPLPGVRYCLDHLPAVGVQLRRHEAEGELLRHRGRLHVRRGGAILGGTHGVGARLVQLQHSLSVLADGAHRHAALPGRHRGAAVHVHHQLLRAAARAAAKSNDSRHFFTLPP